MGVNGVKNCASQEYDRPDSPRLKYLRWVPKTHLHFSKNPKISLCGAESEHERNRGRPCTNSGGERPTQGRKGGTSEPPVASDLSLPGRKQPQGPIFGPSGYERVTLAHAMPAGPSFGPRAKRAGGWD